MKITVLLTTIARSTLVRTLDSLIDQAWQPGDEVRLVSDYNHDEAEDAFKKSGLPGQHVGLLDGPHRDWGHTPRNRTMPYARGDFICHLDDDDVDTQDMLSVMHAASADGDMRRMHMFRYINYHKGTKIWARQGTLARRTVSTQNILHPNRPDTFGVWGGWYGGDAQFIQQTALKLHYKISWVDHITCVYGPPEEMSYGQVLAWLNGRQ